MSMLNRPLNGTDLGEMVASTRDYDIAQKTVSKLIAGEVPARDIAIVGQEVRTVERVTGRLGYATAARSGAINGVLIGLVLSAVMLFGTPDAPISLFLGFILVGVALGMIMSLVTYTIVRRRRDFASMTQMLADHYEVRVQAASLAKARQVLGGEKPVAVRPTVDLSKPPQFGERIPTPDAVPPAPAAPPVPPAVPDAPAAPESASAPSADGAVGADGSAPPAVAQPEAPQSSTPQPEVSQPGVPQSGVPQSGVPQSGVPQSGVPQPGASQPGTDGMPEVGLGEAPAGR